MVCGHKTSKCFDLAEVTGGAVGIKGSFGTPEIEGDDIEVPTGGTKRNVGLLPTLGVTR
jgi:hypothetical protein